MMNIIVRTMIPAPIIHGCLEVPLEGVCKDPVGAVVVPPRPPPGPVGAPTNDVSVTGWPSAKVEVMRT